MRLLTAARSATRRHAGGIAGLALASLCVFMWLSYGSRAAEPPRAISPAEPPQSTSEPASAASEAEDPPSTVPNPDSTTNLELKLPEGWPKGHPIPQVKSNCMRCHLLAGRELTLAVRDFSHSVHDLNGLTCFDCHGGNSENDVKAHEDEFGFIGTKLSAHIAKCTECHEDQAQVLADSPHHWDFSVRINTKFPMCIDCHGNHDVGNPPGDFLLKDVCLDCHTKLDTKQPAYAALIDQNDKYWATMSKVRSQNINEKEPIPEQFQADVAKLRERTMNLVHGVAPLSDKEAQELNTQVEELRKKMDAWLAEHPAPANPAGAESEAEVPDGSASADGQ